MRLRRFLLPILAAASLWSASRAANVPVNPLDDRDLAFDLRLDAITGSKPAAEVFKFVETAYQSDPRPHLKAVYGDLLLQGPSSGAPPLHASEGLQLAEDALAAGSLRALLAVGWSKLGNTDDPSEHAAGLAMLQQGAAAYDLPTMINFAELHLTGRKGVTRNPTVALYWFRRAAWAGYPHGLFTYGRAVESAAPEQLADACALYFEAGIYGSRAARRRLEELVKEGKPEAIEAKAALVLWYCSWGADFQTRTVNQAVATIEGLPNPKPETLLILGRALRVAKITRDSTKKGFDYINRAAEAGNADARAERAMLRIEGYGTPKDPAAGLAELRELERELNPTALGWLGHYSYWANTSVLPKDPVAAFAYSKKAADRGDLIGQFSTAKFYEFGIGTPANNTKAAFYHRAAAWRGLVDSIQRFDRLLAHLPK